MGESRVLSGSGCLSANGDGSWSSMWIAVSVGEEGMAIVRGNIGRGIVGCGDGGGVWMFRWFVMAASIISTAVSSVIVGGEVGVDMVVMGDEGMRFFPCRCLSFIRPWALHRPSDVGDRSQ